MTYRTLLCLRCSSIAFLLLWMLPSGFSQSKLQNEIAASRRTAIVTAVERASPTVVNISAIREQQTSFDEWFWGEITLPRRRLLREVGSGVIVDKNGYILTNHHVIEDADRITVAIPDGREFEAHVFGYDYLSDLALLKVDTTEDLPEIEWGDSDNLLMGEWAIAIGNPFGLSIGNAQPTVTIGIVSATQRTLTVEDRFYEALIQTDASINPGNSGGALVNMHGELIGINTVIRSTSGGSQGVGFAIPANKARTVIQQIIEYGSVIPPYIGLEIQPVTEELAEKLLGSAAQKESAFSTANGERRQTGVLISELEKRSPAATAGMKRGDVIVAISGYRIKNEIDFKALTRLLPLNQAIRCEYIRHKKKRHAILRLKTLQWNYTPRGWGLTLEQPDRQMARKYKQSGVIITEVEKGSGLADALKRGDFIYQINNNKIHSLEIFKMVDEDIRKRNRIQLHFERNGAHNTIFVTFN